jgi:hypothetical protein
MKSGCFCWSVKQKTTFVSDSHTSTSSSRTRVIAFLSSSQKFHDLGWGGRGVHDLYLSDGFSAHAQTVLYVKGRCYVISKDFDSLLRRRECFPAQILQEINTFRYFTLKMEATCSSKTFVSNHQTIRCIFICSYICNLTASVV